MNWIKGNGLIGYCSKVLIAIIMLLSIVGFNEIKADNLSNGKPYYAQEIKPGGIAGNWKWFAAYYNWGSVKTVSETNESKYDVYAPCVLGNCTTSVQATIATTEWYYTQFQVYFYYDNNLSYLANTFDNNEMGSEACPSCPTCRYGLGRDKSTWSWYPSEILSTCYPETIPVKNKNTYQIGIKCTYRSVNYNNIQIALADHIRLDDESNIGTTTYSKTYTIEPSELGQLKKISIPFRSFLINGNMRVIMTNGDPNQFRVDNSSTKCTQSTSYVRLANSGSQLCGIKSDDTNIKGVSNYVGSSAHQVPGDATLQNIDVYFYPGGDSIATFKIYDESDASIYATATIKVIVKNKATDLKPTSSENKTSDTLSIDSKGKPYWNGTNWYSIYHGSAKKKLLRRTITDMAIYPPSEGDLKMTFSQVSGQTPCDDEHKRGSNYSLFALGFDDMLDYETTGTSWAKNDGVTNYVQCWTKNNIFDNQTISSSGYESSYMIQIYNAIAADVYVNNISLQLAKHVRIDNNSSFGTTDTTIVCTKDDSGEARSTIYVGDTQTNTFKLRSFLSTNNLKMKIVNKTDHSTQNTNFKIVKWGSTDVEDYQYEVSNTANVCGYMGADNSSAGSPINTSNLEIKIAFCPQSAGDNLEADLVFYDVVNYVETEFATVHLTGTATAGTLTFDDNSGNHSWFTASNWKTESNQRSTKYPGAADDVQIAATCTIEYDADNGNALCNNMTFATTGSPVLTINADATLVASGSIASDAANILMKADANNSASVLFTSGSPRATVQCYFRGTPEQSTSSDNKPVVTPEWQYRGFIGDPDATGWFTNDNKAVLVYEWSEANKGWITGTNGNSVVTQGDEWKGYSMGFLLDDDHRIQTYTTTLIPTGSNHQLTNLTYTQGQGLNLVTNSFSAPVKIKNITFTNVNSEIAFFKTNTYKNVKDAENKTSLYVIFPQETGQIATVEDNIPAGASFFCLAKAANPSITLPAPVAEASGEMYAPRHTEEFNVLKIYAESDSESDEVYLVESDNCSHNYDDGYDGTKYFTDGMGQIYGKNDFGRTFIAADSSMLGQMIGFKAGSNDMTYTLRFDIERLSGYDELYLYDRVTKRYVNILEGGTYSFTGSTDGEDERFQVIGRMEDCDSFITGSDHALEVVADRALLKGFDGEDEVVYMTDLTGKVVWSDNAKNGPWFELPTDIASGLYIIHCGDVTAKYLAK